MKLCSKCNETKDLSEFYLRGDSNRYRSECKVCTSKTVVHSKSTATWRANSKQKLIQLHGGRCGDCGYTGPPYQFDFDHRDPSVKDFGISNYGVGFDALYAESLKCDLVCSRCHRDRTHKQRCTGCEWCLPVSA